MKRLTRVLIAAFALMVVVLVGHRIWLQFRPLPIALCVSRPMTQIEWESHFGTNSSMPTNMFMVDESPYPRDSGTAPLSTADILKIRALASWGSLLPFRTTA